MQLMFALAKRFEIIMLNPSLLEFRRLGR